VRLPTGSIAAMIGTDLASAVLLFSVPIAYLLGALKAPQVLVVGFGIHTLFVFFDAANFGALPMLAGRERLASATATVYGTSTLLELSVPAAAGALLAITDPAPLLAVDACSFIASALLIRAIRRPLRPIGNDGPVRLFADIREGLSFLVRQPVVRLKTAVAVIVNIGFGAFSGQLVPWADKVLGVPATDPRVGLLFAAWGVGGLGASLIYPRAARVLGEIRLTLVALPVAAGLACVMALSTHWILALVSVMLVAVPAMTVILNAITLRAKLTPDRLQSRVNTAGRMIGFGVGLPLGALAGGFVAQANGPRAAMLLAAGLLVLSAAVAWASPLRVYRHDPARVAA
jgi:predicted MFS family arabinose efflux permease